MILVDNGAERTGGRDGLSIVVEYCPPSANGKDGQSIVAAGRVPGVTRVGNEDDLIWRNAMPQRTSIRPWMVWWVALPASCMIHAGDVLGQDHTAPLPPATVAAWQSAGATVGWLREDVFGYPVFVPDKEGQPGEMPAFRLYSLPPSVLENLPAPAVPFALDLGCTGVADRDLKELATLKNLRALNLRATQVTDAGLKELATLKSLQTLDLSDTGVTDAGLKELAALKGLQALDLYRTNVTDAGLKELTAIPNLLALDVGDTKVTDAGLKELAALPTLQLLDLSRIPVTNVGLKELIALKRLQALYLRLRIYRRWTFVAPK
jgi:internalin A